MVPESGEPPIAAGEPGKSGAVEALHGLLRLISEAKVERGGMGEGRKWT